MTGNFAEMVDGAAQRLGLNDYQLSAAIGLLEGNRVYHPKQVHRLRTGQVRHPDPEVVERLVTILRLDPNEAFAAARVLPHGFDAEHFRKLAFFTIPTDNLTARYVGQTVLPVPAELDDAALLRRLGVPNLERRRAERRRRLRLVPQVERRAA